MNGKKGIQLPGVSPCPRIWPSAWASQERSRFVGKENRVFSNDTRGFSTAYPLPFPSLIFLAKHNQHVPELLGILVCL